MGIESDEEDEEEIKGYGMVNVVGAARANAAWVKKQEV